MKIVISLGGSVFMDDFPSDAFIKRVESFGREISKIAESNKVFVVVGGGKIARDYIQAAKKLKINDTLCDIIGIDVTRLNAKMLAYSTKNAAKEIPTSFEKALELSKLWNVVIMGGTFPGHTTDATAALLAEFVEADLLLNATSVDGVYSADPKKDKNAKKFDKLSPKELVEIVSKAELRAGGNNVLDLLAAKIIERSGIKTVIFMGKPENLEKAVRGEIGTTVDVGNCE